MPTAIYGTHEVPWFGSQCQEDDRSEQIPNQKSYKTAVPVDCSGKSTGHSPFRGGWKSGALVSWKPSRCKQLHANILASINGNKFFNKMNFKVFVYINVSFINMDATVKAVEDIYSVGATNTSCQPSWLKLSGMSLINYPTTSRRIQNRMVLGMDIYRSMWRRTQHAYSVLLIQLHNVALHTPSRS